MIELLWSPFIEFEFMRQAWLGGSLLAISAPPVGVFLMLRRMSLTGDAMSHAILPGAALGYLVAGLSIPAMTLGGLLAGLLVILLSAWVSRQNRFGEDSSLAVFYLVSVALGILLMSMHGRQLDLMHVLLGSLLGLDEGALWLIFGVSVISLTGLSVLYRPLVAECVDKAFLSTVSCLGPVAHIGFLVLVVFNLVAGFHAMGTLMSVGLMVLPAASTRYWCDRLGSMIGLSILLALISVWLGLVLSYGYDWPTSAAIIVVLGVVYLLSMLFGYSSGMIWQVAFIRHHLEG